MPKTCSPTARLAILGISRRQLRALRDNVPADLAPGLAKKIRSALKSCDGAIRNAERFASKGGA